MLSLDTLTIFELLVEAGIEKEAAKMIARITEALRKEVNDKIDNINK
jgi:hypothetical protein